MVYNWMGRCDPSNFDVSLNIVDPPTRPPFLSPILVPVSHPAIRKSASLGTLNRRGACIRKEHSVLVPEQKLFRQLFVATTKIVCKNYNRVVGKIRVGVLRGSITLVLWGVTGITGV